MHDPALLHSRDDLWAAIHAERAALVGDLAGLDARQWATPSLCDRWTVEQAVAHLTAGASTGTLRRLASLLGARFDADLHNDRRLAEHLGATPAETLDRFRAVVTGTRAASGHTAAWLGEIVGHGGDVRRTLGVAHAPSVGATTAVAEFFVSRDFTVASRTAVAGLGPAPGGSSRTAGPPATRRDPDGIRRAARS